MNKLNKKTLYIILASLILIAVLIYFAKNKNSKGIEVEVSNPSIGTIVETIPANGKIKPVTEVKISPDVSGEIVELNFKEGDFVNKGDLIIKIKQDVYISMKERADASLNSVKAQFLQQKAQLEQIELSYKRNKMLYEQKAISEQEYETAHSQYEVAKEQLKSAEYNIKSSEAAAKEAQENLIKTTIYAPMSGTISKLNVEKGERVVGTSQMAGTEMLRIANLEEMEVLVDVNENDIIRMKQNDSAFVEIDAYPGRKFAGLVTQVANSSKSAGTASIADQVTNFEVKILILRDSYSDLLSTNPIPFRPGMSASVSITTQRKQNVLTIPLQAITVRGGLVDSLKNDLAVKEQVFVYDSLSNKVKVVNIKTGIQDLNNIEVLEGLSAKDKIVSAPYSAISKDLKNNSLVSVKIEKK